LRVCVRVRPVFPPLSCIPSEPQLLVSVAAFCALKPVKPPLFPARGGTGAAIRMVMRSSEGMRPWGGALRSLGC
jgi:hypothetical protein